MRAAALVALVLLVYAPTLGNGFVYDDHEVVLLQRELGSLADLARVFAEPHGLPQSQLPYYRPITRASLLIQKSVSGDVAFWLHAGNVLLIGAVALAALDLLRRPALAMTPGAAWFAGAAFALHPIASECVHPIASGRESSMPALFTLLALGQWLRGGRRGRAGAVVAFAAALWSKEQAIVVPLLVAWADALGLAPDAPGRRARSWLRRQAPFALVLLAYFAARAAVLPGDGAGGAAVLEALAEHWRSHPFGPLASFLYLVQSVFTPFAALHYEPGFDVWFRPARAAIAVAALLAILAISFGTRSVVPRSVSLFWVGFAPLAMLVNANLLPAETAYAERFLLVASLGPIALATNAARSVASRLERPRAAAALGAVVLAALAAHSIQRAAYYRDEIAFGRQWAATSPAHANAHATLGAALARGGRDEEAIAALREAIRLDPRLGAAHYNLAVTLSKVGRRGEAIGAFRDALRAWPEDPDAHYALGLLLDRSGDRAGAAFHLREALRLRPGWSEPASALDRIEATSP